MKFYFEYKLGSKLEDIVLKFTGADSVTILSNGKLEVMTNIGSMIWNIPAAYQMDQYGNTVSVSWSPAYISGGTNKIKTSFGTYDLSKPLIF